ncbi:hypothetical protein KSP39_PZI017781 [Platanthera zijinensis]|uniref:Uncharacterized protein n=1 Tax=Platanthera zijinensis TaxID=2320716 RepID=A0AAP0FZR4_9ASPA
MPSPLLLHLLILLFPFVSLFGYFPSPDLCSPLQCTPPYMLGHPNSSRFKTHQLRPRVLKHNKSNKLNQEEAVKLPPLMDNTFQSEYHTSHLHELEDAFEFHGRRYITTSFMNTAAMPNGALRRLYCNIGIIKKQVLTKTKSTLFSFLRTRPCLSRGSSKAAENKALYEDLNFTEEEALNLFCFIITF